MLLGVDSSSDTKASHDQLIINRAYAPNTGPLVSAKPADDIVADDLVNPFDLVGEVEILRYLLDALANHGCLDDVFRSHGGTA